MAEYAKVIVDISQEKLDKTFEYRIPPYLTQRIAVGMQVYIPLAAAGSPAMWSSFPMRRSMTRIS